MKTTTGKAPAPNELKAAGGPARPLTDAQLRMVAAAGGASGGVLRGPHSGN